MPAVVLREAVLEQLRLAGRSLDDDELAARLHVIRQSVNQLTNRLARDGQIRRHPGRDGKLVNELADPTASPTAVPAEPTPFRGAPGSHLAEDRVKTAVKDYLEASGHTVTVRWGRLRGIDIEAHGPDGRWIIEAKGGAPPGAQQVNYFLGALGELVQRSSDEHARYGLALPDVPQYRGLVNRLPALARRRLNLTVFFVTETDGRLTLEEIGPPAS